MGVTDIINSEPRQTAEQEKLRPSSRIRLWIILLLAAASWLGMWGQIELYGPDEPRIAGITNRMVFSGDWLVPRLYGNPFLEKPPLYFWSVASLYQIVGKFADAGRLISGIAGLGVLTMVWRLGRRLGLDKAGAGLAALVLLTMPLFFLNAWKGTMDMLLTFFVTGAFLCFYEAVTRSSFAWSVGFAAMLGGAVMTKGLVGAALPAVALGPWVLWHFRSRLRVWVILLAGGIGSLLPAAIWLVFVHQKLGWDAVHTVAWTNNFGRFLGTQPEQAHMEPVYYYLKDLPLSVMPWTFLWPIAACQSWRVLRRDQEHKVAWLYAALAVTMPLLLLTVSSSKREIYVLPILPMLALLTALAVCREQSHPLLPRWSKGVFRTLTHVAGAGVVVLPAAAMILRKPFAGALVSAVLFVVFVLLTRRGERPEPASVFTAVTVFLLVAGLNGAIVVPRHQARACFLPFEQYREQTHNEPGLSACLFAPDERIKGAALYYLDQDIPHFWRPEDLDRYLAGHRDARVITGLEKLKRFGVADLEITASAPVDGKEFVIARRKPEGADETTRPKGK